MIDRLKLIVSPLASLKLTVTLFTLAMVLIFAGTLAQREAGNWEVVSEYFRSWFVLIPFENLVFKAVGGVLPFPGGLAICVALLINLLAVYGQPAKLAKARMGILLIHGGLILLIVGELVTGAFAEEGMMNLREGSYASYVQDMREVELAFTKAKDGDREDVVVVPESILRQAVGGEPVRDPRLPVEVRVLAWMPNSVVLGPQGMAQAGITDNPATQGHGKRVIGIPQPATTGVDTQVVDQPGAYVELLRGGESLGTYLVTTNFSGLPMFTPRQDVEVAGESWQVELRYKRTYKPYTIHLIDATHETFVGTTIPRNFSSLVRLVDPEAGEDREVLIYMNNPLRYRGDTFFQSQMGQATDGSGVQVSGLQVVTNPGWLLPYISCILVSLGLTVHFGIMLWKFVNRGERAVSRERKPEAVVTDAPVRRGRWIVPAVTCAIAAVFLVSQLRPPKGYDGFELDMFGRLPVVADGRVKPLDTVARSSLHIVSGKQTLRHEGQKIPAIRWLAETLAKPQVADAYQAFRVDDPDVKRLIGVGPGDEERKLFSFTEIMAHREKLVEQYERASAVAPKSRNAYQQHLVDLADHLTLYGRLQHMQAPYVVPPVDGSEEWQPLALSLAAAHAGMGGPAEATPAALKFADVLRAYSRGDAAGFNRQVAEYARMLDAQMPELTRKGRLEQMFNRVAPFYQGIVLYVVTLLLGCFAVLLGANESSVWSRRLGVVAVSLLAFTFVLHTLGLGFRMYLEGRPPVTNLYSSAVFIGWVAVALCLFIERYYRNYLATILASIIGFATLIIAHNLADGDTMQMMQAVLDSNFWLATHVITVTVGYAATFVAGAIAIAFILTGVYTRGLTPQRVKSMGKMMYGTIAFALLFSFVGTVLGGIWADQSWGRFWGWDPKENGAVLIVLMNALILHARWGGMIQQRGVAVLAVGGNIITAWSWFGTNMLGVGLHSYGFMDSAMFWLLVFVISQVAIMSVGLIPMRRWASFDLPATAVPTPTRVGGSTGNPSAALRG